MVRINNESPIRFNAKEIIIPWFRLGVPEPDLDAIVEAVNKTVRANKNATL